MTTRANRAGDLLQEATNQMNGGKYSRAFAILKELLAADPSHLEARRLLATLLVKLGNLATAKTAFETLAKEAVQRRDFPEAQSLLRDYLVAAPRCVPFLDLLGQVLELSGDPLAAVFEYEKAVDILLQDPDPERPTYAQDLFEKIKRLAPGSFVANRVASKMPAPPKVEVTSQREPDPPAAVEDTHDEVRPSVERVLESSGVEPVTATVAESAGEPEEPSAVLTAYEDPANRLSIQDSHAVVGDDEPTHPAAEIDETDQIHETNQIDEIDQTDQRDEIEDTEGPTAVVPGHEDRVPFPPVDRMPLSGQSSGVTAAGMTRSSDQRYETNETDQTNQRDTIDQTDQSDQRDETEAPEDRTEVVSVQEDRFLPVVDGAETAYTSDEPHETNQIDEIDQTDQRDETDDTEERADALAAREDRVPFPPVDRMAIRDSPVHIEEEAPQLPHEIDETIQTNETNQTNTTAPATVPGREDRVPCSPVEEMSLSGDHTAVLAADDTAPVADYERNQRDETDQTNQNRDAPFALASSEPDRRDRQERPDRPNRRDRQVFSARKLGLWLSRQVAIFTRRLLWLTSSFTRLAIALCLASVAWVVVVLGLAAGTWIRLEEKPSDLFEQALHATPAKVLEDPKTNGYLLLLGFSADETVDPIQAGYDRWLTVRTDQISSCYRRETDQRVTIGVPDELDATTAWFRDTDPASRLTTEGGRVRTLDARGVRLNRYKQWLTLPFDDWGFGAPRSVACGEILAVHRLYLAEGFAQGLPVGVERLESDVLAWRKVAAQARTLSMKALAVASLHDDAILMSGLLARPTVDAKILQRLGRLAKPMDADERSLKWPVHDEFVQASHHMDARVRVRVTDAGWFAAAVSKMPLPKQRTLNAYAAYSDRIASSAWVPAEHPLFRYELLRVPPKVWTDYAVNPIDNLLPSEPLVDWAVVSDQVLEIDARLRLAGLQARLRAPSSERSVAGRVAQAGAQFFDPFSELPMLVQLSPPRLYSVGPDRQDNRGDSRLDLSVPFVIP